MQPALTSGKHKPTTENTLPSHKKLKVNINQTERRNKRKKKPVDRDSQVISIEARK